MKAILIDEPGDETVLRYGDTAPPSMAPGCVRLRVAAAGVNRADLMQRQGMYPPPPGASPLLGLECAGEVVEVASDVGVWKPGDRVMALLAGGGYAEEVVVDAGSCMPVPTGMEWEQAAAIPEAFLTVHLNVFRIGGLEPGGWALVHGGGSGIGTAAIQMIRKAGAHSIVTAGSPEKCQRCLDMGADVAVDYRQGDFVDGCKEATDGKGVDLVLDHIGAKYLERNLASLALGGRLVMIGLMGGAKAEINLAVLLGRRLELIGSTLRARPESEKAELVQSFMDRFGAALNQGELRATIDRVLPLSEAAEAHRVMKASEHFGKIVLRVGE